MATVSGDDIEGVAPIPPHANKKAQPTASERAASLRFDPVYPPRSRIDAYFELVRIDLYGLDTCGGGCAGFPFGRCEHHEVEHRRDPPVNPRHPNDLAIAYALRFAAEFGDYEGIDHRERILEASAAGRIDGEAVLRLLKGEEAARAGEIESAAFEIMTARYGWSPIGIGPDRRWRKNLSPLEQRERKRLEEARHNGGFTDEDRARYEELTERRPVDPFDWRRLPPGVYDEAKTLVNDRRLWALGKCERRVSATDRRRLRLYIRPPLSKQLGVIMTSDDPFVLERAVRELRRNAKRLGFHAPDYDRRRHEVS